MSFENISFSIDAGVARLRLNRPAFLNALSRPLLGEFREALDLVAASPEARVLVLSGEGRGFSSGADLSAGSSPVGSPDFDAGGVLEDYYNPIMERLFALPVPTVAALHGPVVGAACMLSLAADVVVAARSAYFLQAFVNIGLVPDAGATWLVAKAVGRTKALEMALLGERISADAAQEAGLVTRVVDDGQALAEAQAIARKLASGPTVAIGLIRKQVAAALNQTLDESLAIERAHQTIAGRTADFREAVAAFGEKRAPQFEGK